MLPFQAKRLHSSLKTWKETVSVERVSFFWRPYNAKESVRDEPAIDEEGIYITVSNGNVKRRFRNLRVACVAVSLIPIPLPSKSPAFTDQMECTTGS